MRTADFLFLAAEPASFAWAAMSQLRLTGTARRVIPMEQDHAAVMQMLRESDSDAICLISPFQFQGFLRQHHDQIRALGKPIIAYISEHTFGNPFPGYAAFEQERRWADVYACAQDCDTQSFRAMGWPAFTSRGWVADDVFIPGKPLTERIQKFCFIGHTRDYVPGMYAERRRVLEAFAAAGVLDILNIPRAVETVQEVADAYARYAAVLCPPANGRGHSIRLYEAAATGALLVEVGQPLDPGNNWFIDQIHRIALRPGIPAETLTAWARGFDFTAHQKMASAAQNLVRSTMTPEAVWADIFAAADTALG